jgi:hypothetical protein
VVLIKIMSKSHIINNLFLIALWAEQRRAFVVPIKFLLCLGCCRL